MKNKLIASFRFLRNNLKFTLLNIIGLSFGFSCALFIMMHVVKETSFNSELPEHQRVFQLAQKSPESQLGNTTISYALTPLLANSFPEIETAARTECYGNFNSCILSVKSVVDSSLISFNEPSFYLADQSLFRILQFRFIEGSPERALNRPNSIVLSDVTARKFFGTAPALGKVITLNQEKDFVVSGVVEFPSYVTFRFSVLAPLSSLRSEKYLAGWDSNGEPYFKLSKNVDYKAFNQKICHFYSSISPKEVKNPEQLTLSLIPITDRHLYYNKNPLYLLMLIGFVVLMVSILNYINLSTSLVQKRSSEIALKKISGAAKHHISLQFFSETALIAGAAILIGLGMTWVGTSFFRQLTGSDLSPFLHQHGRFFLISGFSLWLIVSLLASSYPSLILSGVKPLALFKKGSSGPLKSKGKYALLTVQFIISILLIILTLMIDRQYRFMADMPLGFDNNMVMQIPLSSPLKNKYDNLADELQKLPEVKAICAASSMPAGIPNNSGVSWTDLKGEKQDDSFGFAIVSEGYTQTFDMEIVLGESYSKEKGNLTNGILVNESAARRLGFYNPIGQTIRFWGRESTIIGVVKDFQNNYLFNTVKPMVISAHPKNQHFTKFLFVSLQTRNSAESINKIEAILKPFLMGLPFEYHFTKAETEDYIKEILQLNKVFRFASVISIILALVGLVALTYQATRSRTKEIGIRKVNGARRFELIILLNRSFMLAVGLAFLIAVPIAYLIVEHLLQGIGNRTTISIWIFLAAGLIVGMAAFITAGWLCWQAATRNPVEALRYE